MGIGIGVSQACDGNPTRDEQIRDLKKTANAADRKGEKARTQIAILTQTPQK